MSQSQAIVDEIRKRNEEEIVLVQGFIKKLGTANADGSYSVKFGVLFKDTDVGNTFEALAATLKNAKTRGILTYASPLLLQGAHDNVDIVLKAPAPAAAAE